MTRAQFQLIQSELKERRLSRQLALWEQDYTFARLSAPSAKQSREGYGPSTLWIESHSTRRETIRKPSTIFVPKRHKQNPVNEGC